MCSSDLFVRADAFRQAASGLHFILGLTHPASTRGSTQTLGNSGTKPVITNDVIFFTQVASILGFLAALFALYRLLVENKDSTIQLQKENIAFLKDQLAEIKAQTPDVLAQSLAGRVKLFEDELSRLIEDKSSTEEQIRESKEELRRARVEAEELNRKIAHASEMLREFQCPHCGAALSSRSYESESAEYRGREIDIEHTITVFSCGLMVVDDEERGSCGLFKTRDSSTILREIA